MADKKSAHFNVPITEELKTEIKIQCARRKMSQSQYLEWLVRKEIDKSQARRPTINLFEGLKP